MIMDIVESSFVSWRGVTADNIFMSTALAEELFKKCVKNNSTVSFNKRDPHEFFPHPKREKC